MSQDRYVCIHGHFYQPPRENPWLESVETQDSAKPFHDWNERITVECYEPNRAARILDENKLIVKIINNYERLSFNFGPTLLAWMELSAPQVYRALIEADVASQSRYSGHGSAFAQAYSHMILPLANSRDKETQVRWGIEDFVHRFGRRPEGMWLPETAVDIESLERLAEHGVRFTVLAPSQAYRYRNLQARAPWQDATRSGIDTKRPYLVELPSGATIQVFFYDGAISQSVAFERLLSDGERFVKRLMGSFSREGSKRAELVHIATDGETYGHHHRFGDMALAYALESIEHDPQVRLTNYGEYLSLHPPDRAVEIVPNSSWSCAHGVERWRGDCGCKTGGPLEWTQRWRAPLRDALDWLRDQLAALYEQHASEFLTDPWEARNDYIRVVLDRSPDNVREFLRAHASHELNEEQQRTALKLLELQRAAMLMYTSCGWFFDEISRVETRQILRYAGRALQLAESLDNVALEDAFLELLAQAQSNLPEMRDGRHIYESFVRPARVNLEGVAAHYAVGSLFSNSHEEESVPAYRIESRDAHRFAAGRSRLVVGRARVTMVSTLETRSFSYGALHFGGHQVNAGVREFLGEDDFEELLRDAVEPFEHGDFTSVIRLLDRHFGESTYSLKSLFRDQRSKILDGVLDSALIEAETAYSRLHEHYAATMRFVKNLGIAPPDAFTNAARVALNAKLRHAFEGQTPEIPAIDVAQVRMWLDSARSQGVELDSETLSFAWRRALERLADNFFASPRELHRLARLDAALELAVSAPFDVDLWKVQNGYYLLVQTILPEVRHRASQEDPEAKEWLRQALLLGDRLSVKVSE